MSNISTFEAAILTIPSDMLAVIVTYVSEQAFSWTGHSPADRTLYWQEQGRQLQRLREIAWDKQLDDVKGLR